jgi:hypothetical protein
VRGRVDRSAGLEPATADYHLERKTGCEADNYTGPAERRGRWLGDGAGALGLTRALDQAGEAALRALLDGRHPDGGKLLSPVLRLHAKAQLPAAPLLEAIQQAARGQDLEVPALLEDAQMTAACAGLVRRSARGKRGRRYPPSGEQACRRGRARPAHRLPDGRRHRPLRRRREALR